MTETARHLCRIAVALCLPNQSILEKLLREAVELEVPTDLIREVILTAYLFDGYPSALEGFRLFAQIHPHRGGEEIQFTTDNISLWRSRGEALCRTIYGEKFDNLMARLTAFAPELLNSMIIEGYGKVLARPQLQLDLREYVIIAMLTVKNRPRQLLSHCLGALRVGAATKDVMEIAGIVESVTRRPISLDCQAAFNHALTAN